MLGCLLNEKEVKEMEYVLKKELEELLHDLEDHHIEGIIKRAMEERYQLVFRILQRFSTPADCVKYMRHRISNQK
ncbi:hypothetical protein [Alkalihalobacillus sp. AL-G]|uniref:hypothetical protein n=1 Tax=Alkalihalobacillus sp. AL-G TaxID=2926399 RepID=UPI00272B6D52|nr:hypothetical protein [Alkalihalobacillus sp. AL-G]WLD93569.1 hypothetical protein MOJ78_01060 [Alkalihalobacillus sp. AL-G]